MNQDEIEKKYELLKEEFQNYAYIVSHDLNAPVRHIKEFTRLMLEDLSPHISGEVLEYKKFINESIVTIENKLNALLRYSRANTKVLQDSTFDSLECIKDCAFLLTRDRKFNIDYKGDFPQLKMDLELFTNVIDYLLDNASKFTEKDSLANITVQCDIDSEHVIFKISDLGIGIPENKQKEIFELFRKLSLDYKGEGVGLTVAQQLLRRYKGFLTLESTLNQGSTFNIHLPLSLIPEKN